MLVNINILGDNIQISNMTPSHSVVQVGTTSTIVLPENLNRKYVLLANNSDTDMFINFGSLATIGEGVPINAKGNYQMPKEYIYNGAISAIHTGIGTKNLLVTEMA